jgi:hypothetical protein
MKNNLGTAGRYWLFGLLFAFSASPVAFSPHTSLANIISVDFSGTINSVADNAGVLSGLGIVAGTSTFTGSFSYDTAAGALGSNANTATYSGMTFSVLIDGSIVLTDNPSVITISNDLPGFNRDGFFIGSSGSTFDRFDLPVSSGLNQFFLNLFDSSSGLYNSTALPNALSLAQFDTALFSVVGVGSGGVDYDIDGVIDTLSSQPSVSIAEPGSLLLLGVGVLNFVWLRRRRRPAD